MRERPNPDPAGTVVAAVTFAICEAEPRWEGHPCACKRAGRVAHDIPGAVCPAREQQARAVLLALAENITEEMVEAGAKFINITGPPEYRARLCISAALRQAGKE